MPRPERGAGSVFGVMQEYREPGAPQGRRSRPTLTSVTRRGGSEQCTRLQRRVEICLILGVGIWGFRSWVSFIVPSVSIGVAGVCVPGFHRSPPPRPRGLGVGGWGSIRGGSRRNDAYDAHMMLMTLRWNLEQKRLSDAHDVRLLWRSGASHARPSKARRCRLIRGRGRLANNKRILPHQVPLIYMATEPLLPTALPSNTPLPRCHNPCQPLHQRPRMPPSCPCLQRTGGVPGQPLP